MGQRVAKTQPEGGVSGEGISPPAALAPGTGAPRIGESALTQQGARIWMLRCQEQRIARRDFHDPSEVEHQHPLATRNAPRPDHER